MSVSTKESISIGLAHEFIGTLTRRGVTGQMFQDAIENKHHMQDKLVTLLKDPDAEVKSKVLYCTTVLGTEEPPEVRATVNGGADLWSSLRFSKIQRYGVLVRGVGRIASDRSGRHFRKANRDDLLGCTEQELVSVKGIGLATVAQVQDWLVESGYPPLRQA